MHISEITIKDRFRKDLGDVRGLADSIADIGLLHPIVISQDKQLVCGQRRLEALKMLDIVELKENEHYRIVNIEDVVRGERDENVYRMDFLPSEAVAVWKATESHQGLRNESLRSEPQRRDKVANYVGMGTQKLQHAKAIMESGNQELIDEMDKTGRVNSVYRILKITEDEQRIIKEIPKLKLEEKYKTIVVDPPWRFYGQLWGYERRAAPDYATLTPDEIEKYVEDNVMFHIPDDAHIYLWIINNRIKEGLNLLEKWGFDFKTIITWVKPTIGIGHYFRNNTEHMLFGVKGSLNLRRRDLPTWFKADRGKHSVKPDNAYEFIERASYPPYLDVFARKKREGWTVIGDTVKREEQ